MNYLLDTCVVSELIKKHPDQGLVTWIVGQDQNTLFISSLTLGEIQKGISKLAESSKKLEYKSWLERDLLIRFANKTLAFSTNEALQWGRLQAETQNAGRPIPIIDSMIAATALFHGMTLVTRNGKDFEASDAKLFNPWS